MARTRQPAVAGSFYPADAQQLEQLVRGYLAAAEAKRSTRERIAEGVPKALIVPHAGYVYSGAVAAKGYVAIAGSSRAIERVVLLGPSHRVPVRGLAVPSVAFFATPLGDVAVDRSAIEEVQRLPQVSVSDAAHEWEHSLEVQLPFLQCTLDDFLLVPFSVGEATAEEVDEVLDALWGGPETLIVVSSDLSHYHDYATAQRLDAATTRAIEALQPEGLDAESACGRVPARGLLTAARRHGLRARTLDLCNSGDTAGPRDRVVGYGAYVFCCV